MSHAQYEPTPQAPPPWPAQADVQGRAPSRVLPILGAVLGSLGLIAGVAAWFRAAPANVAESPVYSEQQVSDAKRAVCEAYAKGWHSLQVAGNQKKPDDPADTLPVVAVNGRVAEVAVGNYLINSADANPSAPNELKTLMRQLGAAYQDVVLTQLAGGSRSDVTPIGEGADQIRAKIEDICH